MSNHVALKHFLRHKAYLLREHSLRMTTQAGSGHPTSCLSAADLVAALFFDAMRFDPRNFNNPDNDRFILSKGHAAPLLYAAWKELGLLSEHDLMTYRHFDSPLEGHPTSRFPYAEAATGSLGMGLSIGAGMCMEAKIDKRDFCVYVLLGDAEMSEGSVWEAAEIAAYYRLHNLIAVLDCNRLGQSTESLHNHHVDRYAQKFAAFGWKTIVIDGHDMQQIMHALDSARESDIPAIIIAKTLKGYGVSLFQDKENFHGKALNQEQLKQALQELQQAFSSAATYNEQYQWQPQLPQVSKQVTQKVASCTMPSYKNDEKIATRKAYGQALAQLGACMPEIVSLDAEVKNSTFAELFEEKFPERFIQCFVAEQNMVSMGVGLQKRGKIPFISTFAAFFTRAFDQIRMAAISRSALRLVGSHCGVSIGQDGPSQMGLEDIACIGAVPDSIILYPCDAVSAGALVNLMANYHDGISYLRTTRMETSIIYNSKHTFYVGGSHVVKESERDVACIIAAGVTVFEALKAYEQLRAENISIAVIDAYSIKPLDTKIMGRIAQKSGRRVITVEDHYLQGGLGQSVAYSLRGSDIQVTCLAVTQIPRSGKPEELLAWAGIDAAAIIRAVKSQKL